MINGSAFLGKIHCVLVRLSGAYQKLKTKYWYGSLFKACGHNCYIEDPVFITPSAIKMGNGVFIRRGGRIEGVSTYLSKEFSPTISFGDHVSIEQNVHITCAQSVSIGRNTAIAANVTITDIEHPYDNINLPPELQDIVVKPVVVGDDCKIYNNAVILPGVTIGKHCIIGANSVVNRNIPDLSVAVGAPIRIVRIYCPDSNTWVTC